MRFWQVQELVLILAIGLLAGAVTWLASAPHPDHCRLAAVYAGRPHYARVCR